MHPLWYAGKGRKTDSVSPLLHIVDFEHEIAQDFFFLIHSLTILLSSHRFFVCSFVLFCFLPFFSSSHRIVGSLKTSAKVSIIFSFYMSILKIQDVVFKSSDSFDIIWY